MINKNINIINIILFFNFIILKYKLKIFLFNFINNK